MLQNLQPGDYFIVVDGYIGATSTFNLEVECLDLEDEIFPDPNDPNIPPIPPHPDYPDCETALECKAGSYTISCTTDDINLENHANAYGCNPTHPTGGKEKIFTFSSPDKMWVRLSLRPEKENLDLFLLDGLDPQNDCLRYSAEKEDNWDGFWFLTIPDKPYYIIVDGFDEAVGAFELEVNCVVYEEPDDNDDDNDNDNDCPPNCGPTPLDCKNAPEVFCGLNEGDNFNGVANYLGWGNCKGKQNSGKEVIYLFDNLTTQKVTFYLRNMDENLNLYILNFCNPSDCNGDGGTKGKEIMDNHDEAVIKPELAKGLYYIVIDGVKGAKSKFELEIVCDSPTPCLEIPLVPGITGNLISSNLLPTDKSLDKIVDEYQGMIGVFDKQDNSQPYSPGTGNTTLKWGDIDGFNVVLESHIVDTVFMEICGRSVDATLSKEIKGETNLGFPINLIGFPFADPIKVSEAFSNVDQSGLERITYSSPNTLENYDFIAPNGISDFLMLPGRGYRLYSTKDREFAYSRNNNKRYLKNDCEVFKTLDNATFERAYARFFKETSSQLFAMGDEIGFFDQNDNLLGSFKYNNQTEVAIIQGNDPFTTVDEGFEANEAMVIKVYHSGIQMVKRYQPVWKQSKENNFGVNGLYDLIDLLPLEKEGKEVALKISVQPNPLKEITHLSISAPKKEFAHIEILSLNGTIVQSFKVNINKGRNEFPINLSQEVNGLYYAKITGNTFCEVVSLIKF